MNRRIGLALLALLLTLSLLLTGCGDAITGPDDSTTTTAAQNPAPTPPDGDPERPALTRPKLDLSTIPAYTDQIYVEVNGNVPYFTKNQYVDTTSYEYYTALDTLGRCGIAVACVGKDIMPTEGREDIGSVTPSGWIQGNYDVIPGGYLYNRCHLIGFQLTGENANKENLITGTSDLNQAMIPFENMVADHVKDSGNHVLYRATPIFEGDNLVATGVQLEAWSIEDNGESICFNVFLYNVQPGIVIDYKTGNHHPEGQDPSINPSEPQDYILNTSSKKFHHPDCSSVGKMSDKNKQEYHGTREDLIADGYKPCGICNP